MLVRLLGGATVSASPIALALRLRVAGPGLLGPGLLGRDRVLTPGLPGGLLIPSSTCEAWDTEPRVRRGSGFSSSSSSSSSESSSDGPFCLGGRPTRRWCPSSAFLLAEEHGCSAVDTRWRLLRVGGGGSAAAARRGRGNLVQILRARRSRGSW